MSIRRAKLKEAVIISAVRTPIGRYMGALKDVMAYDLGAMVLTEAIKRAKIEPGHVDEVILGQSYQSGEYVNIARKALLKAGWPDSIPGITLDRRCCTGLDVVCFAGAKIQSGNADVIIAAGVESMSTAEFYISGDIKWGVGGKKGMPRGHGDLSIWGIPFYDRIQRARVMSQLEERYGILPAMMSWADTAAKEEGIPREECDLWSLGSHQKACAAIEAGKFKEEMVAVKISRGKGDFMIVNEDEGPRADTSLEKLSQLKPVLGGYALQGIHHQKMMGRLS
jgi:acetyl-CoA C-acetyltransferase